MGPVVYVFKLTPELKLVERDGFKQLEGFEGVGYLLELFLMGGKKIHGKFQVSIEAVEGGQTFVSFKARVKKVIEQGDIKPTTTFDGRIGPGLNLIKTTTTG